MQIKFLATLLVAGIGLIYCATARAVEPYVTNIVNTRGQPIGQIRITPAPTGVLLYVKAENLPAGAHGFHVHAVGNCSDFKQGFVAAKGHVNHAAKEHGLLNPKGIENGDLPNLYVSAEGKIEVELFSNLLTFEQMQDKDGSAFIIHKGPDDYLSQPIGGAGERIACAVVGSK